jgi:orotidine-5'-phosphate decarboxylase
MGVLASLGADMLNLHAAGGSAMMRAALEAVTRPDGTRPLLIAVTQLTSTSPEVLKSELLIDTPLETTVLRYAALARDSGLDGVVCSALETKRIHTELGAQFLTVTPGIRFADSAKDDQVRIVTPLRARENGSDYIVVGRPITASADPAEAYLRCRRAFLEGRE